MSIETRPRHVADGGRLKSNRAQAAQGGSLIPDPIVVPSLQEAVYDKLRRAIQEGALSSQGDDQRLGLRQLADHFGVSTMPVREAVRRLEAEGLLTFSRGGGVRVTHLSAREFNEIAEMRVRLETLALEWAFERLTGELVLQLEATVRAMDVSEDQGEWFWLNFEFHQTILGAADSPRLLATIGNLWTALEPYLRLYAHDLNRLAAAQEEHRALLAAIKAHDLHQTLRIVEDHIRRVQRLLTDDIASHTPTY